MEKIKMRTKLENERVELSAQELESVAGGYSVQCTYCKKIARGLLPVGVTVFHVKHKSTCWGETVWYGKNGDKWWG